MRNIKVRKKPGPHPEKPLDSQIKTRIDKETLEELDFCKDKLQITRSEAIRRGIHSLYNGLKKDK